jgi:hypothetical protein
MIEELFNNKDVEEVKVEFTVVVEVMVVVSLTIENTQKLGPKFILDKNYDITINDCRKTISSHGGLLFSLLKDHLERFIYMNKINNVLPVIGADSAPQYKFPLATPLANRI